MKKLILGVLAVAGAWCAQAEIPVAERYRAGATEPEIIMATSADSLALDQALFGAVCNETSSARIVLLRDIVIGDSTTPNWGKTDVKTAITFDLNGHRIDASGYYCKWETGRGITAICDLTIIDSVGGGGISGYQTTCTKGASVTFNLPMNSVVSSDTGFMDWSPRGSSEKGAITINGGRYDGCVHGSDDAGTTLLTGGFFNKSKNGSITSYDHDTTKYFDNGDGYWRVVSIGWNPVGMKVNGVDLADAPGAGWAYAGGVLSLTNAQSYTLSGANTTGAVRVEVTANANVTLNDLTLICDSATADLIRFTGANATLTLSGTSTVYAKNGFAAIQVGTGGRLAVSGTGALVGGRSGSFYGRGVCVYNGGTLDWNGGTLRDYYFRKSGSTDDKGAGICVFDTGALNMYGGALKGMYGYDGGAVYTYGGPVNIYGGDIAGNTATFGAALYCRGTVNVYGGNITNNVAEGGIACAGSGTISVYGGVASGNSGDYLFYRDTGTGRLYGAVGTDLAAASPLSGKSVVKVTDTLYAIGENVTATDGKLTGGTYTFNPTNAEYSAAGLAVAKGIEVQRQGTNPVTYLLHQNTATVTPQPVSHASYKVYTNDVEVASPYVVNWGATVKVVYTAETDYVFAGGGTTAEATFEVTADPMTVPEKQLPADPIHLSGVTVNGLDVSALYGEGWEVIKAISGGYYTVRIKGSNREYVLHGTNTEGYVRFDVTATDASLVVSNLTIGGYADNACAGIYMDNGSGATMTLKGVNAISGGQNRPAVEVQYNSTLAIGGDGSLAAFPGDGADPIGRYSGYTSGTVSYSGGRYNYAVPEDQLAAGFAQQTISETEGGYTFISRIVPKIGVTVGGTDVAAGAGDGWVFADGILSLTNATAYTLSGTNTEGAVRIEVTASAAVELDNLELRGLETTNVITFASGATNATLTLSGSNTVYGRNNYAALDVANGAKLTLDGDGNLVGGKSAGATSRGFNVEGSLVMNGGTIRDYHASSGGAICLYGGSFTMNDGALRNCRASTLGGCILLETNLKNIVQINGGLIAGCTSDQWGGVLHVGYGTVTIAGGTFEENTVASTGSLFNNNNGSVKIYGGVFKAKEVPSPVFRYAYPSPSVSQFEISGCVCDFNPSNSMANAVVNKAVTQVGDLYVVGSNVTANADAQLLGGAYTFCPTNAEYAAAGLVVATGCEVQRDEKTTPVTYRVSLKTATVTPQPVSHASYKVYTNDVEVASPYVVDWGATVKVVYSAEADYVFAGGGTTAEATFEVTADPMTVPEKQLPADPIHLSGVTVNGLDVSALYGGGWEVVEAIAGGYYTVQLKGSNREYVLHGTNTGGYVRFDVGSSVKGASLVVSNLTINGYANNECAGIYLSYSSSATMTLKGVNAISGGKNRPAVEVQDNATLAVGGDGSLAAFPGEGADPIGRYSSWEAGSISYSGGRYNYAVSEGQLADGFMRQTISETEGGYTFVSWVVPGLGVKVNGRDVKWGSGDGWTFADGLLSLTNATAYTLSGTNTEGAVRIKVTASAAVELNNLTLTGVADDVITFSSGATNATLTLVGDSTVYPQNDVNAVRVEFRARVTLSGDGALVGDKTYSAIGCGVYVLGEFVMNSGTIADSKGSGVQVCGGSFTMNGGTISGGQSTYGGGVNIEYGTVELNAGTISSCSAAYGGAVSLVSGGTVNIRDGMVISSNSDSDTGTVFVHAGTINVWGGTFTGNSAEYGVLMQDPLDAGIMRVYGGIFADNTRMPAFSSSVYGLLSDWAPEGVVSGHEVKQIGGNYIVGSNVTVNADAQLSGGAYTFVPTNAEYAAAGVTLADNRRVVERAGDPTTYQVLPIWSTVAPQDVVHATFAIFTNETAEVTDRPCVVAGGTLVKVVYTADAGYVFANGTTEAVVNLIANDDVVQVPADLLPVASLKLIGVTVNGTDVANGSSNGWVFADGVLALTNAIEYVLAGTSTAGVVRVEVTTNAAVKLENLYLTADEAEVDLITFTAGATNATLALSGVNTIYAKNELAAIGVVAGATLTVRGDGDLVGGRAGNYRGRGVYVKGTLNWMDGTVREYFDYDCGAIYVDHGTANIYGGDIVGNEATFGAALYCLGTVNVYGGNITNNAASNGIVCATRGTISVYGGVVSGNSGALFHKAEGKGLLYGAVGTDLTNATPASGYSLVKVTNGLCVVGSNVTTTADGKLSGGTYTFNPTNALYVASGLELADYRTVVEQAGETVRYQLVPTMSEVTPQEVANTTFAVFTNGVEVASPHRVAYLSEVTVVYTANAGYVFPGGTNAVEVTFVADADPAAVPSEKLPKPPAKLTGVTINGIDAAYGFGEGWTNVHGEVTISKGECHTLAGTNAESGINFKFTTNVIVTLDNLRLTGGNSSDCGGAALFNPSHEVTFLIKGTNEVTVTREFAAAIWGAGGLTTFDKAAGETDESAVLIARGNGGGAGIGTCKGERPGPLVFLGGTIEAHGGDQAAGIGSGNYCADSPSVTIKGGIIHAYGGELAAGIGEGSLSDYGAVTIEGGFVEAVGGKYACSDIGVGDRLYAGVERVCQVTVKGGTVAADYLGDRFGDTRFAKTVAIVGGSYGGEVAGLAPTNAAGQVVWKVTMPGGWADGTPVEVSDLPSAYGTNDIVSVDGNVCLWLPDGAYTFAANGTTWHADVESSNATAFCQSTVVLQDVAHTTVAVYTNGTVEVTNRPCVVAYGTSVKVVYTADAGYVFANGATTAAATFVADAEVVQVPEDQLPSEPFVAKARVTQASGEDVYAPSFVAAMNIATNGATVTLLADLEAETLAETVGGFSYALEGDGHSLRLAASRAGQVFTVLSNETVCIGNVLFDGAGLTNGLVSVLAGGRLTMTNCVATGFVQPDGTVVSVAANGVVEGVTFTNNICAALVGSSNEREADEAPLLTSCMMKDNGDAANLRLVRGVSVVTPEIADGVLTIERGAMLAFASGAPEAVTLDVPSALSRIGEQLITNACGVAVAATDVGILVPGVRAVGTDGNVFLDSETNYLYAVEKTKVGGQGQEWRAYETFGEAYQSQPQPSASTSVSLVHYRNAPNCVDIAEQGDDLTVGAGSNIVLRTVLRTIDEAEAWNGSTTEAVALTGTLTVRGALTLENVAVKGAIVLAGGSLTVGEGFALNDSSVLVTFADGFGPSGEMPMKAIASSAFTGEELLKHFRLAADDLYFKATADGLSVVKAAGQVARTGETWFDTFNAAVMAATNGEDTVAVVSVTNTATGEHRDEVKFGANVTVGANERLTVKSVRATGAGQVIESLDENPTVPTVLMLEGSKVTLGAGATLAFTNVATTGALTLEGEGVLDLAGFTGTLQVCPTETGRIAVNVTDASVLQVAAGAEGELYYKGTEAWWKAGRFSAVFVQTGNGAGTITINDFGHTTNYFFSDEKSGSRTYHYQDTTGLTGTDTNLTFGVVYCVSSDAQFSHVVLPSTSLYGPGENYPMYKSSSGEWLSFDKNGRFTADLPLGTGSGSNHMTPVELWVRNYGSVVKIADFQVVATKEDAQAGMQEGCDDDDTLKVLQAISDVTGGFLKVADIVAFITGAVAEEYVAYTVIGWINAARSVASCILRATCDAYVGDGEDDSDYYPASSIKDAYKEALEDNETVYVFESVGLPSYTLEKGKTLTLDAAGSPLYDTSALLAAIAGSIPEGPFAQMVVAEVTGWVAEKLNKGVHELAEERNPHAIWGTSASVPMITVSSGATLNVSGIKESYQKKDGALSQPLFAVSGTMSLKGTGKVSANDFSGFEGTGGSGLVRVDNGGKVFLESEVTANAYGANFFVENGGLVLLKESGKSSKVGISGQTGNGAVFSNTKQGWGGEADDYAAVFSNDAKPENCTLAIDASSGNVYWNIPPSVFYLDLNNIPHYATYGAAAADCAIAYVLRPNAAVEGVIGANHYNALFTVSVINDGTVPTPYTLKVDLTAVVSNAVQTAIDAALPSLVATATNATPTATVSTQAGLYYGIKAAAEVGGVKGATGVWTLGTGNPAQAIPGTRPATDKSFYLLKADILPEK